MWDWLIQNARIADGGGAPCPGDVAVEGGRIAAVGRLPAAAAAHTVDAAGRLLTPGFLDIHRHADARALEPGYGEAELAQGITTVINGCCGMAVAPVPAERAAEIAAYVAPVLGELPQRFDTVEAYLRRLSALPPRINLGQQVGMGVLRAGAAGFAPGDLTPPQLRTLHASLERALGDGAVGVSLGLGYAPECFYSPRGLLEALAPLRDSGVVLSVHMRQEGDGVESALEEMLTAARALRTPVEISHLKAIGRENRGRVRVLLERIASARAEGLDVSCDAYPYTAGATQLIHVLPPEFLAGGTAALTVRLQNAGERRAMRIRMETGRDFENITRLVGFENVLALGLVTPEYRSFEGKSIAELAAAQGRNPFDALFDLLAAEACRPAMIDFITAEEDVETVLRAPFVSVISDAVYPPAGRLHPRVYGSAARVLERYAVQRGVLTADEAVRRLSRLPAERYGLRQKGRVAVGADADLCMFDPAAIHEMGTWADPAQCARGMDWVFVGGVPAIAEGRFTDHRAGRVLTR